MSEVTPAASGGTNAAYEMALEDIDVSNPDLFRDNAWHPYFKRLREEDPVHYCKNSMFGPYWSVTKYRDIMAVEKNPKVFSSEGKSGGITIMDDNAAASLPMFIAMDPPKHDVQREAVSPIVSSENVTAMQSAIRERTAKLLDSGVEVAHVKLAPLFNRLAHARVADMLLVQGELDACQCVFGLNA